MWVFGYGSLVSPVSLAGTLGRDVTPGDDFVEADLAGWGRRWNYGVGHVSASWHDGDGQLVDDGVIVALGLVAARDEHANGIITRVSDEELARLDHRERDYDRVDVTASVAVRGPSSLASDDRCVTYVPRPTAIARYEQARDRGRAGIRSTYWALVDEAFAVLGDDRLHTYRRSTPAPDVPIVEVVDSLTG